MKPSGDRPLLFDFKGLTVFRGDRRILHDLDLQVRQGEHIAILGPNGCGKSTLIKTLTRELYPVTHASGSGRFHVLGRDQWDVTDLRRMIGVVALDVLHHLSHEVTTRAVTVRELVLSGFFGSVGLWPHQRISAKQERGARAAMRFLDVSHLANRSVAETSSGEQRRALIARALVHDPAALLLDEPTASLDPGAVREFRATLRKLARSGRTLVLVTHTVADLVPEIDRVILMNNGRIVADGRTLTTLTSRRLSALFGTRIRLVRVGNHYDLVYSRRS